MDPIIEGLPQDALEGITELADGSAIIEMPEEDIQAPGHYDNLVNSLDAFTLNTLATDYLDLIEKDKEARKKRDEQYEEGIRRTGLGDDAPGGAQFNGASRAVHPTLAEGCVDFAARAIKELFPANGPVKTKLIGKADTQKLEKARKKRDYLNFLLTKRMRSYRDEKEVLLTQLPLGGSQFEKYFVDPTTKQYFMEFLPVDKVILPAAAVSFQGSNRVAVELDLIEAEFEKRIASGFYSEIQLVTENVPEQTRSETASAKVEGKSLDHYNEDGVRRVYEILTDTEIAGETGPFVLHLDEPTGKLVGIYRNWKEDDEQQIKLEWLVENKFIPWRGALGIGLYHLIGGLAISMTGALRALLDSAHINNSPGAVKLKGGRASGENIQIEQTQIQEIEAPTGVDDIRKVMMPLPFNPPSPVLFQLLDWLTTQAKGVVATAEEKIADASNTMPVGTALALIEQGSQVFSSIHARLHESQRRGLEIVCRLVHDYPNAEDLQRFGLVPEDFDDNDDVQPVSDPAIFSEAQRYAQLQEALKVGTLFPEQNWNRNAMARRSLELLRVDFVDEWLPPAPQPITADPVSENFAAVMQGAPLKAAPDQDHVAHLREHLRFLLDPLFGAGPVPFPPLQSILQHCSEHLMLVYQAAAQTAAAIKGAGELNMAEGAEFASQYLAQTLDQLGPIMQQAGQVVQSKAPQPPVDPAVQKTFEASMAEIKRKEAVDKAEMDHKTKQLGADQQLESLKSVLEERAAQSEAAANERLEMIRLAAEKSQEELRQQVELMKNDRDNEMHQITELLKNRDDNQTQVLIAQIKEQMAAAQSVEPRQDEGMLKEMQRMLGEIEKAKTGDALTATIDGLRQMMESQQSHQERTMALIQQLLNQQE